MIKVFGAPTCKGCIELKTFLTKKKVDYTFFDIRESDGLAELALCGLADELVVPIVVVDGDKVDVDTFISSLESN